MGSATAILTTLNWVKFPNNLLHKGRGGVLVWPKVDGGWGGNATWLTPYQGFLTVPLTVPPDALNNL